MTLLAGGLYTAGCSPDRDYNHIGGALKGASAATGHRLREGLPGTPTDVVRKKVVIAGGGIAGLSAARKLSMAGMQDFVLLELEAATGGNAGYGENKYSQYPLGAHYLPLPNIENKPLLQLLEEAGIVTGYENGLPVYDETALCFDPEERLLYHGHWQEGLVPQFGNDARTNGEIKRFLQLMQQYREQKDAGGKWHFDIPMAHSSNTITALDSITMEQFLHNQGFTSAPLLWYVDYGCRDDYGAGIKEVSALAGIHYFAARRGKAANADASAVLTWPEGNGYLVKHLRRFSDAQTITGKLVYKVATAGDEVHVDILDARTGQTQRIIAAHCILAMPQFIAQRLLQQPVPAHFSYAPWLVANFTLKRLPVTKGAAFSWDNVMYGQRSVGYVYAQQQALQQQIPDAHVITLYWPLDQLSPADSRRYALGLQHQDWVTLCTDELERMHPGIHRDILEMDCWIWGHAMVRPVPGFYTAPTPQAPSHISFAHSDLGGISIFEEAFYHGELAAQRCLAGLHLP